MRVVHQVQIDPVDRLCQTQWFRAIPPERIGLDGEFDYYGLAKRVRRHLKEQVGLSAIRHLRVYQRGRVVIFTGKLPGGDLERLIQLALEIGGVDAVEAHGLRFYPAPAAVSA